MVQVYTQLLSSTKMKYLRRAWMHSPSLLFFMRYYILLMWLSVHLNSICSDTVEPHYNSGLHWFRHVTWKYRNLFPHIYRYLIHEHESVCVRWNMLVCHSVSISPLRLIIHKSSCVKQPFLSLCVNIGILTCISVLLGKCGYSQHSEYLAKSWELWEQGIAIPYCWRGYTYFFGHYCVSVVLLQSLSILDGCELVVLSPKGEWY